MSVIVAKNAGFCQGVKRAIETAKSIPGGCQTLGKLIHNNLVISQLEDLGINAIVSLDKLNGKPLVIRSHGVGKDVYEELKKRNVNYVDATCPFVKKIHEIVEKYFNEGYKIIIVGDKNHPEVIGTNGWCNYEAIIIGKEEDIPQLDKNSKYCIVAQTTFDYKIFVNISNIIKNAHDLVVENNTICYTTSSRQAQADELSKKSDLMLVIGSKTSSNTTKLYDICKVNCSETFLIETIADLNSVKDKKYKSIGIVAGASTPQELIQEVKTLMSDQEITKKTSFEELFEASKQNNSNMRSGRIYDVKVINAREEGIEVNFGAKKDGFIDKSEVEVDGVEYDPANYPVGTEFKAKMIEATNSSKDYISFSKRAIDQANKDWEDSEAVLKQPEFKAVVNGTTKGGLKANVGPFEIFIPSSQIKTGFVPEDELKNYVGKTLRLRAIKSKKDTSEGEVVIKRGKKSVIASQKVIIEEEKAAKEKALWEFFVEGKVVTGKVVRIKEFGAFVKVNGFECLAHASNLSYKKNAVPSEILEEGKSYEFLILKVDKEKRQVSLGYKQLQKSLYEQAAEKYPVGSVITGPVRNITEYGAYVFIEDGVDGLVPIAEISRKYVKNVSEFLKEGQEVSAQVIKFDVEKNRITLSIKALLPEEAPQEEVTEEEMKASNEKRNQRNLKKFENVGAAPSKKKTSKEKEEVVEESLSTTSQTKSVSVGDLISKYMDLDD